MLTDFPLSKENGTKVKCWVEMGRKSVIQEGHTDGKRIRREEESCVFPQGDSGEGIIILLQQRRCNLLKKKKHDILN